MQTDRRIIVLTGVSRGLGLAMAEGFIGSGHTVCGAARNADAVANLANAGPRRIALQPSTSPRTIKYKLGPTICWPPLGRPTC